MADKGFGVKKINLIGASGTPTLTSPNNLNLNAVNVAISTDVSIGGTCTAYEFSGATASWMVGNDGTDHYTFIGSGISTQVNDPELNLYKGQKYIFHNRSSGHPFRIQSTANGSTGTQYNIGVTNNDGSAPTDIIFEVPQDAPDTLYYQCTAHSNMGGRFIIGNPFSGGVVLTTTAANGSYSVTGADAGKIINMTGTSGNNSVNISSLGSTLQPGDEITVINNQNINGATMTTSGSAQFILMPPAAGNAGAGQLKNTLTMNQLSFCKVLCISSTEYYVYGHGGSVT